VSDYRWTKARQDQLWQLDKILEIVRDSDERPKPGFLATLQSAAKASSALLSGEYPTFMAFLRGIAERDMAAQRQVDELHELLDDFERMITHSEDADTTVNQIVERIHRMRETHQVR
jgi:hypothetical protein